MYWRGRDRGLRCFQKGRTRLFQGGIAHDRRCGSFRPKPAAGADVTRRDTGTSRGTSEPARRVRESEYGTRNADPASSGIRRRTEGTAGRTAAHEPGTGRAIYAIGRKEPTYRRTKKDASRKRR